MLHIVNPLSIFYQDYYKGKRAKNKLFYQRNTCFFMRNYFSASWLNVYRERGYRCAGLRRTLGLGYTKALYQGVRPYRDAVMGRMAASLSDMEENRLSACFLRESPGLPSGAYFNGQRFPYLSLGHESRIWHDSAGLKTVAITTRFLS
jgi:hypothetical protein